MVMVMVIMNRTIGVEMDSRCWSISHMSELRGTGDASPSSTSTTSASATSSFFTFSANVVVSLSLSSFSFCIQVLSFSLLFSCIFLLNSAFPPSSFTPVSHYFSSHFTSYKTELRVFLEKAL